MLEHEGNPVVISLRLIRAFTDAGNLMALAHCTKLIDNVTEFAEKHDDSVTSVVDAD